MGDGTESLRAELAGLLREFEALRLAQVQLAVTSERGYTETRCEIAAQRVGGEYRGQNRPNLSRASGLTIAGRGPRTAEEALAAPVWCNAVTGEPMVNSVGRSLIVEPGFRTIHLTEPSGPHAEQAQAAIESANQWALGRLNWLAPMLWPGRDVQAVGGNIWPDVVDAVAEVAQDATLAPAEWCIEVGPYAARWPVSMWQARKEWTMGPEYTTEDEARIGDDPVTVVRVRDRLLSDSRRAIEWLLGQLEPAAHPPKQTAEPDRTTKRKRSDPKELVRKLERRIAGGYEYTKSPGYKKLIEEIGGSSGTWTNIFADPKNAELKAWTENKSVSHRNYESVDQAIEDDAFIPDDELESTILESIRECDDKEAKAEMVKAIAAEHPELVKRFISRSQ